MVGWRGVGAVLLLVAGCLGAPDGPEGGDDMATGAPPVRLVATVDLTGDGQGWEPGVEVDGQGTIYVTAARGGGAVEGSRLWVSRDGGATFAELGLADAATGAYTLPLGAEGDLATDAAGATYFVDFTTFVGTSVSRTTDQGRTWSLRSADAFAVPVGDRPWVAAGAADEVAVTWNQLQTGLWVAVSTDGGLTFPVQTLVPGFEGTAAGPLAFGPDGSLHTLRCTGAGVHLLRSDDGGRTFVGRTVHATSAPACFIFAVPAFDAAGRLYAMWNEEVAGNVEVVYAVSPDRGDTWGAPVQVSRGGGSTALPWLAAADDGLLAIAYYAAPADAPGDPNEVEGPWTPVLAVVEDAAGPAPGIATLALTEAPVAQGLMCARSSCGTADGFVGHYLQVAFDPAGRIHAVWADEGLRTYWGLVAAGGAASEDGPVPAPARSR